MPSLQHVHNVKHGLAHTGLPLEVEQGLWGFGGPHYLAKLINVQVQASISQVHIRQHLFCLQHQAGSDDCVL
jgi:hypothetical protein